MPDMIYRQQAIDAFKKELTTVESKGKYITICSAVSFEGAKQILEALSPVQPQIIHCADCRYQDKGSNESGSWNLCGYRPWLHVPTEDEHYCGYAERRTDEQNS